MFNQASLEISLLLLLSEGGNAVNLDHRDRC